MPGPKSSSLVTMEMPNNLSLRGLPTPPPMPGQYPSRPSPYRKEKVDGGRHFRKRRHTKKSKHPKRKTRKSSRRHH